MTDTDSRFAGSVPALYERYLAPMFFQPYALDIAQRAHSLGARRILEVAAGTGVVTRPMVDALPDAVIDATDLNGPMLAVARTRVPARVRFSQADAMRLPFAARSFDLLVCQFAVMFFPDRLAAFREARRVLDAGGSYLFSVWDSLKTNDFARIVTEALARAFPQDPPLFMARTPHGHGDCAAIERDLRECGFVDVQSSALSARSKAASARDVALGICEGTPLRHEILARDPDGLPRAVEAATAALRAEFGNGSIDGRMHAFVFSAR